MNRLIIGCGYLGLRVARLWRVRGDHVAVLSRDPERAQRLRSEGLAPLVGDVTNPESLAPIAGLRVDTLLYAVGHDRAAGPTIHEVYPRGLAAVLAVMAGAAARVIYISTTGVYGPADGDWVDEATPPRPGREGGVASLEAERTLRASAFAEQAISLRLAGIYGPGRVPFLDRLKQGEPIAAPASGWLNLIHVDDAADIVVRAADAENVSQVLCVSDGNPPQRRDYYSEAARLIGAAPPRFESPAPDSPRALRAAADKRVSNRRLLAELRPVLSHPSYREGLASILGNRPANG